MKKFFAFILLLFIRSTLSSQNVGYDIIKISKLDKQIFETSGLVFYNGFLWTHNDGGNESFLYKIDTNGVLIKKIMVKNAVNNDWEELAHDDENFYIGDFGNNSGNRQNLKIVIVKKKDAELFDTVISESIEFTYTDQLWFKNKRQKHNFDCEAMICYNDKLFLFTKNWKNKKTKVYSLDKNLKNQVAVLVDSFNSNMLVTAASVDPYSNKIVLVGYKFNKLSLKSYIVEISDYSGGRIFNGKVNRRNLHLFDSQTEAVTFVKGKSYLYMTREGIKKRNLVASKPKLYKLIPNYMSKNGHKLTGSAKRKGYDWWWHSFVGKDAETGELKPFFIEYYVINPGLWKGEIIFGQKKNKNEKNSKPCYAMIKAGAWGNNKSQLHNFYGINEFKASDKYLNCTIGNNMVTESRLLGEVIISKETSENHPEMMSDAGNMKWDLKISDKITYDVGYGSSDFSNALHFFHMYWHVQGMKCNYAGTVEYNGRKYIVDPEGSFGYQDKNWGKDYTNPWIWLNCNNFISANSGKKINASLDIGGGCPRVLGVSLNRRIITAFYYEGEIHEFNFSKFWLFSKQKFKSYEDNEYIYWDVTSENKTHLLEVSFKCKKENMLLVNYENPEGEKNHNKLWNGGHAFGTVKFYKKGKELVLIDELVGSYGGCEYGEY
jgi:hypothetical protein